MTAAVNHAPAILDLFWRIYCELLYYHFHRVLEINSNCKESSRAARRTHQPSDPPRNLLSFQEIPNNPKDWDQRAELLYIISTIIRVLEIN